MKKTDYKIHIIGAGISGLVAAVELERLGYRPTIIEANNHVGGRVTTEIYNGYQLDHGFQVLLEAYPLAKKYLKYTDLELQRLLPGAVIFRNGKASTIGDATRNFGFIWSTITASVGSMADKIKIFNLNKDLKNKSIEDIFNTESKSTLSYLQDLGFSDKIIDRFFKPFFSGIFLESHLETSSRMFEFVYKMFGNGLALIPKRGIGAIPEQLKSQLKTTQIKFNTKVKQVNDANIVLESGEVLDTHFTIITTNPSEFVSNVKSQDTDWRSCTNLYFTTANRHISKPIIGLIADQQALVNNVFYHTSVETEADFESELLSVTVVKSHELNDEQLIDQVKTELKTYCGMDELKFLKLYHIPMALPQVEDLQYDIDARNTKLKPTIFVAGDYLLNASLNAAMLSGERAAQGLVLSLEDGLKVEELSSEYIN